MDLDNQRKLFETYIGGSPLERTDTGEYRIRRIENDWQLWQEACASWRNTVPPDLTFDDVGTAMDVAAEAATRYTSEMGDAAERYYASFPYAHKLPAQWRWADCWADCWAAMIAARPEVP